MQWQESGWVADPGVLIESFEVRSDPDPVFKIWSDPALKTWSDQDQF